MLTDSELAAIAAADAARTPGEWTLASNNGAVTPDTGVDYIEAENDVARTIAYTDCLAFENGVAIVSAVNAIPLLLADRAELLARIAELGAENMRLKKARNTTDYDYCI